MGLVGGALCASARRSAAVVDFLPRTARGFLLECEGFSDTIAAYLNSTVKAARNLKVDETRFQTQLDLLRNDSK